MALTRGTGSRLAVQTTTINGEVVDIPVHATVDAAGNLLSPGTLAVTTTQSGTIAASGGTAAVTFTTTSRQEVINASTGTLWAAWGAAPTVNGAGSFPINAGGSYAPGQGIGGTLQLLSTAASQAYTVNRFA
jgi:hypothetical protein